MTAAVLGTHFSVIRAAIAPRSFTCSSTGSSAGVASSNAARKADSPPKASAFPFIVLSMLINPLFRLDVEEEAERRCTSAARRQQTRVGAACACHTVAIGVQYVHSTAVRGHITD